MYLGVIQRFRYISPASNYSRIKFNKCCFFCQYGMTIIQNTYIQLFYCCVACPRFMAYFNNRVCLFRSLGKNPIPLSTVLSGLGDKKKRVVQPCAALLLARGRTGTKQYGSKQKTRPNPYRGISEGLSFYATSCYCHATPISLDGETTTHN